MNDIIDLWDWRRRTAELYADIRGHKDPEAAWLLWCETRVTLFRTHPQSPIEAADRASHMGPDTFPYDPSLRLTAGLVPAIEESLDLPVGEDGVVGMTAFARTQGLLASLGGELTLYWIGGYGGGVFLPFTDATGGHETYAGGRYLLDTIKGADLGMTPDGRVILDFNFAYFPSCAHSPRYVCPLAPAANRLPGAVRAGERLKRD